MAAARGASSSSSSTTSSGSTPNYEVFLSFHGNDVRHNFADHLYRALIRAGIQTFRDSEELHVGNEIGEELFTSIQESKISIPIFSKNYPSSKWCLKELIQMSECRKTLNQIVMPIFYKVEPRDVRNQTGIYEKVFEQHQIMNKESDVRKWKEAMKEVGRLNGWHVDEKTSEGEIVEEVVNTVYAKLKKRPFGEDDNLVGVKSHLREMLMLLDIESENRKIIGIQGLGGIGKTTIAKIVYNEVFDHFEGCSFIANIREAARQHDGLVRLQKQLLWDALKYEGQDITIVDVGTKVIQQRLCSKKVLVVLDDVDHEDQVKGFLGDREWFGIGSKVIITTRNERVLDFWKSDEIYKPLPMNLDDSLQLFSHHAFKSDQPPNDYLDLSKAMIETTGGLPLALQVIGSSLNLKEKPMWKGILKKLQKVPNNNVMERLRISFDGLEDEEKKMFLDVACFFIGMYKNIVCYIWEGCDFQPLVGLNSLCEKSLITISEKGVLWMHDLLRDMGRNIVYQENDDEPGKRTRIWSKEDVWDVLKEQEGTSRVMGLNVDFRSISEKESLKSEGFDGMTRLRLLRIDYAEFSWNFRHSFSELRWLSWKGCPNPCIQTDFRPCKLVVLDLSHSNITTDWMGWKFIKMAKNLKVLDLSWCDHLSRTPDLSANQNLEVLRFSECDELDEIDASICLLTNLVILDMEGCWKLRSLPAQISKLTNLQQLNLINVPENLGHMVSLRDLKLSCGYRESAIVDLSVEISQLTALQSLALYHTSGPSLKSISSLSNTSLTSLHLGNCRSIQNISGLPSSLTSLTIEFCKSVVKVSSTSRGLINLKTLHLMFNSRLEEIEGFDEKLDSLEEFTIGYCNSLGKLPNLRGSKCLRTLRIYGNDFISNFEGLEGMDSLEVLEMWDCKSLMKIPDLQDSKRLRILKIRGCPQILEIGGCLGTYKSLQALTIGDCCHSMERLPHHLSNLHKLRELEIKNLGKLTEFPSLDRLGSLRKLRIAGCDAIRRLPDGLPNKLTHLYIAKCKNLTEIHGIDGLENLEELTIRRCESLERLPADLSNLKRLKHLEIEGNNKNLDEIEELNISGSKFLEIEELNISGYKFLEYFSINGFRYLQRLTHLSICKKLTNLSIEGCDNLNEILGVGELESLQRLHISGCESLESLPDLSNLKMLEKLLIKGCKVLTEIHGVDRLEALMKLHIIGCESLQSLPDLSNLKKLKALSIAGCKILTEILGVDRLQSLEELHISGCESLETLPDLSNLKSLRELSVEGCKNRTKIKGVCALQSLWNLSIHGCSLTHIHGIDGLHKLTTLRITGSGCDSLEILPDLSNFKRVSDLYIEGCKNLTQIQSVDTLGSLWSLNITKCDSLEIFPNLSNLTSLTNLTIEGCKNLTQIQIQSVDTLESLSSLSIIGCGSLEILPNLSNLKNLEKLIAKDCKKLIEIQAGNILLESLWKLDVRGCISLEKLPDSVKSDKLEELNGVFCFHLAYIDRIKLLIDGGCSKLQLPLS